ncbi:MAG: class I SAM-dependent methyltransferase [Myxococcota bacterium]
MNEERGYDYRHTSGPRVHHDYLIPALEKLLPDPVTHPRLLDLGCGHGSLANYLRQKGFTVTGIDSSKSGLAVAKAEYPECNFHYAALDELPLEGMAGSFDVAVSLEVIEHLFHPRDLLTAARFCLVPGAPFILTTPYHGYLKNLALALSGGFDRHFSAKRDGHHIKFWSVATLSSLLESEGWKQPSFSFAGRAPFLWKSMLATCTR